MNTEQTLAQMRTLKLTGMAQAYQTMLQMPVNEHPTADMLIAQLIEAETLNRDHKKMTGNIKAAKFRYQAAIEEIEFIPQRNLDKNAILRLANTSFIKRGENVLITGSTGCGKSYIASALGYQACQMGFRVAYYSMSKLLQRLQLSKADGSFIKELTKIEKVQLLILDDWGMHPLDNQTKLYLLQIIEDRHGKCATIITSQLPVASWFDYINEPTLADAILDRLLQQAHRIEITGESMRKRKKMEEKIIQ
jgi:DNA replication protein DnaC